ncbi:MAG: NAD(P)H-dependent glycerol-3-phosphate dehydrogenase [Oscillospiraceae bacterium]|nr:NAD(P)H-dependent glycerol-3-phosphate dehydrogenase [Oscillospiraceae bacterium]
MDIRKTEGNAAPKDVFVIGCGRWGTFLAWYLHQIGHRVSLYGRKGSANLQQLSETGKNAYLTLPEGVRLSTALEEAAAAEYLVISVSSQSLRTVCGQLAQADLRNKTVVLCMKGLEVSSGKRLSQVAEETLHGSNRIAVWLGPGHVQDFLKGIPNCMVIDSSSESAKEELISAFSGDLIRFYYGTDPVGNEIGAAAKNVIGIAAGMLDGLDCSTLKGALMSRGSKEIGRLIAALGGAEHSAYGLCHLGDYEATLFSEHSQNRRYGEAVVTGNSYEKLAEGAHTVKALRRLGELHGVELPICESVYQILYGGKQPRLILEQLFNRSLKSEF